MRLPKRKSCQNQNRFQVIQVTSTKIITRLSVCREKEANFKTGVTFLHCNTGAACWYGTFFEYRDVIIQHLIIVLLDDGEEVIAEANNV